MKNVTVSVNDELYHRARVRAAERKSTVSALVRDFLTRMVEEEPEFERLRREQNRIIDRIRANAPDFSAADRLQRDELHDRRALR